MVLSDPSASIPSRGSGVQMTNFTCIQLAHVIPCTGTSLDCCAKLFMLLLCPLKKRHKTLNITELVYPESL